MENEKKKIENRSLKSEKHHICTKSKKTKHFPWAINSTCLKHSFRTFFTIFVLRDNSKMIDTVTARLHKLILAVHNICKKKRNFLNFYPRLKSAEAFTMNTALLSSNSTNSLLKSVRKTSSLKFQPHWMIFPMKLSGFIHFIMLIRNFQNDNPPQKFSSFRLLLIVVSYVYRVFCAYC